MSRSDKPAWLLFLLVAVPSSVLSCLITIWIVNPSPLSEPVLTSSEGDMAHVVQELRELRARLDDGFRTQSVRASEASPQERQPLPPSNSQVDRIANIVGRLDRLLRLGQPTGAVSLATQRNAPINWSGLSALIELDKQDAAAALGSVRLLTMREVAARFGFPIEVQATRSGPGMHWYYPIDKGQQEASVWFTLAFTFRDGYVTSLHRATRQR